MHKNIIIPIHGILVDVKKKDDWPERFEKWLNAEYTNKILQGEYEFKQFSYGYLTPVISWLTTVFDWLGWKTAVDKLSITRFKKFILKVKKENPNAKIHIIAHSFGTWTAQRVLRTHPSVEIQSLTLVGAAISAHIRRNFIDDMVRRGQVKACFSWSSHNDRVIRYAPPPFGHLGYWGFLPFTLAYTSSAATIAANKTTVCTVLLLISFLSSSKYVCIFYFLHDLFESMRSKILTMTVSRMTIKNL